MSYKKEETTVGIAVVQGTKPVFNIVVLNFEILATATDLTIFFLCFLRINNYLSDFKY